VTMVFEMAKKYTKKFGTVPFVVAVGLVGAILAFVMRNLEYFDISVAEYHFFNTLIPAVRKLLEQNQFCQVVVFSTVSAYVLYLAGLIYRALILPLFAGISSSITIHNTDPNFNAVIDYVSDNMLVKVEGSQCRYFLSTTIHCNSDVIVL
jgi:hypothetical protein